jgi:ribonuclease BN (tRNA processing enzyme)
MPMGAMVSIAGLKVKAIPINHPVPAAGFVVSDGSLPLLYSADTGPDEGLWKEAAKAKNLKAIIVDASFPNSLEMVADASGHFTPAHSSTTTLRGQRSTLMCRFMFTISSRSIRRKCKASSRRSAGRT